MDDKEAKLKILAQTIYELRGLLTKHIGESNNLSSSENASANLVYALHNEALAIIENREHDFQINTAIENIKRAETMSGISYSVGFQKLINEIST